ncbi:MAG: hypothetical protein RSB76_03565 [Clostridia bacterium]
MFVVNFKLNYKKILFICVVVALLVATILEFGFNKTSSVNAKLEKLDYVLTDENFTEVLKTVHDNIDMNLDKSIKMSGFVFKMPDFKDGYFVCGRNTIVDNADTVAGFLCNHPDFAKLVDNEWIEVTGIISKGEYNGTMPIIKVGNIKKINSPANTFVKNINEKKLVDTHLKENKTS